MGYGGMFWLLAGLLLAGALALFLRFHIVDFAPLSGTQRAKS